jgi:hypothetical protein
MDTMTSTVNVGQRLATEVMTRVDGSGRAAAEAPLQPPQGQLDSLLTETGLGQHAVKADAQEHRLTNRVTAYGLGRRTLRYMYLRYRSTQRKRGVLDHRARRAGPREHGRQAARSKRDRARPGRRAGRRTQPRPRA